MVPFSSEGKRGSSDASTPGRRGHAPHRDTWPPRPCAHSHALHLLERHHALKPHTSARASRQKISKVLGNSASRKSKRAQSLLSIRGMQNTYSLSGAPPSAPSSYSMGGASLHSPCRRVVPRCACVGPMPPVHGAVFLYSFFFMSALCNPWTVLLPLTRRREAALLYSCFCKI